MKKIIAIVIIATFSVVKAEITDKFVNAVIMQESTGRDNAVGDNGKAIGCMQIWKVVVDDVNKYSKVKYTYSDRYNRKKSIEIFKKYVRHYATRKRLGRKPTQEDYARIWNGGPNGWKKSSTKEYWEKLKVNL